MCLTTLMLNPNPEEGGYQLILAFNRDEFYGRPTKASDFWQHNPNIISGQDMSIGKEGGTWLGMNRSGRLAMLLNIQQPDGISISPRARGRGFLVSDFLQGSLDGQSYLKGVAKEQDLYNGFNLITIELRKSGGVDIYYYTNFALDKMEPIRLEPGVHAFSNHTVSTSWPRTSYVQTELEKIVGRSHSLSKDQLTDELLTLMMHEKPLLSSSITMKEDMNFSSSSIMNEDILKELIFFKFNTFGTRSTTVILVDAAGHVSYTERTLREPINPDSKEWHQQTHTFAMLW